jgi:RNA polymerase sigma factor (sigma-70 family)
LATLLGHLHETALAGAQDPELLRRFTTEAGAAAEAAFTVLVRRHGPAVLRACRDALRDRHDAEDAFQATFLVLATRARSLAPRTTLGPWLAEVARRVSAQARAVAARRRAHEMKAAAARTEAQHATGPEPDLAALVLSAVGRLPERYRAPLVLCDLDGLTYQEAATRLGLSHAAVRNRLARGRHRLRAVLLRMGAAPAAATIAPSVPRALAAATARAAVLVSAGAADGVVPESVLLLMKGGLLMSKLKSVYVSMLTAGILVAGAVGLNAQRPLATTPAAQQPPAVHEHDQPAQGYTRSFRENVRPSGDPADRITQLAQEVKRKLEEGDVKGARQTLRRLHAATFEWEDALADERPTTRPADQHTPALDKASSPRWAPPSKSGATADVETRLREVENKLDRLLKALEGRKDTPRFVPLEKAK